MIDVWLKVKKGKHMAALAMRVHIHPLTFNFYLRETSDKRLSLFFVCPGSKEPRMLMLTSGNVEEKHWAIGFGCIKLPSVSQVLCRRNGPWEWLDAVDVRQISCISYCPWWIISVPRKTLNFKKVPTIMSLTTTRYKPQHHWRQPVPHIPLYSVPAH